MRILQLDSGREMRGGQWQALRLHRALVQSGHESLLLAREGSPLFGAAAAAELPCQPLRSLRVAHLSRRFDIVHAHDAHSHSLCALWARVPFVVSRRVAFPVRSSAVSRWKYARAQRYIAVSRFVALMLQNAGVNRNRIDVVYDGVEVPPQPANGSAVIAPYTTDTAKGMALVEEASRLAGIPVVFSRDLERDLAEARALVYVTYSEGLGSGVLLGMAHGLTTIASRTGGIPELIEDGVTGILIQNEASAVADAMKRIDPTLGAAARSIVQQRFTVGHVVQGTLDSYRKALHA